MNKNSKKRLKMAQKAKLKGNPISKFDRPAPYKPIILTLNKTEPLDIYPKVARKSRNKETNV